MKKHLILSQADIDKAKAERKLDGLNLNFRAVVRQLDEPNSKIGPITGDGLDMRLRHLENTLQRWWNKLNEKKSKKRAKKEKKKRKKKELPQGDDDQFDQMEDFLCEWIENQLGCEPGLVQVMEYKKEQNNWITVAVHMEYDALKAYNVETLVENQHGETKWLATFQVQLKDLRRLG